MVKKLIGILSILSLLAVLGCSTVPKTIAPAAAASVKSIREAEITSKWTVKQLQIDLNSEISIMLKLAVGDKVEGYYYLEEGSNLSFQISGTSLIYESVPADGKSETITSDRFSFTASQAQGIAYTLTFTPVENPDEEHIDTTVFLEIIYPASGSLYIPIGTK